MDPEKPPGLIMRILMRIDPSVFFAITQMLKATTWILDKVMFIPLFHWSFSEGHNHERINRELVPEREGAQLVRVLFKGTFSLLTNHTLANFFYKHVKNVDPEWILRHDNVTLHGITDKCAFFCVSNPKVNVYETKSAPFLWIIQYLQAEYLIIVNHDVFIKYVLL